MNATHWARTKRHAHFVIIIIIAFYKITNGQTVILQEKDENHAITTRPFQIISQIITTLQQSIKNDCSPHRTPLWGSS